mgnify:CR=1 FL=1
MDVSCLNLCFALILIGFYLFSNRKGHEPEGAILVIPKSPNFFRMISLASLYSLTFASSSWIVSSSQQTEAASCDMVGALMNRF